MKKHRSNTRRSECATSLDRPLGLAATKAMKDIGDVVYAIRLPDSAIKIGWTSDLAQRRRSWRIKGNEGILAVMPGTIADEQAIHDRLVPYRSRGREYYHQTPEVLAEVNALRGSVGMQPLDSLS